MAQKVGPGLKEPTTGADALSRGVSRLNGLEDRRIVCVKSNICVTKATGSEINQLTQVRRKPGLDMSVRHENVRQRGVIARQVRPHAAYDACVHGEAY
ncbi:hypothetical protein FS749_012794 [Ceratobasidium sp. UAMH 11750]|nr:hypothetical protein FS749_012794 [Ceratobasidium sp. UAMH 11750]